MLAFGINVQLDFPTFCEVLACCADAKTHDGIMRVAPRLENFLVGEFFQKVRAKTNIATMWR